MATRQNFPNRIEKRQSEAKARQAVSDKLTVDQKLAKATLGSKEHTKLQKRQK